MRENNNNQEKIKKEREKIVEEMEKEGAKKKMNRDEKGRFSGGYHLEVTPDQIEKAEKEMRKKLEPIKLKIEELGQSIKELEEEWKKTSYINKQNKIENEIVNREKELKEFESLDPDALKKEKEEVIREIERRFGDLKETKEERERRERKEREEKERIEKEKKEKALDQKLERIAKKIVNGEVINEDELEVQKKNQEALKEKMTALWKKQEEERKEKEERKKIRKVAEKIVNNEVLTQKELEIHKKNQEKVKEELISLWGEKEDKEEYKKESENEKEEEKEDGRTIAYLEKHSKEIDKRSDELIKKLKKNYEKITEAKKEGSEMLAEKLEEESKTLLNELDVIEKEGQYLKNLSLEMEEKDDNRKLIEREEEKLKKRKNRLERFKESSKDLDEVKKQDVKNKIKLVENKLLIINNLLEQETVEKEESESEKENKEESKAERKEKEEVKEDEDEEKKETPEGLPENLVEHLQKSTFGESNKTIIEKGWSKFRKIGASVGGALGLKGAVYSLVPGAKKFFTSGLMGAGAAGGIAGIGLKLGSYGFEKWEETKKYKSFKDNLVEEIENKDFDGPEIMKEKLTDLETNISIMKERLKELSKEKTILKEDGVWFFQKERRELTAEIKKHKNALTETKDQARYLSVEIKKEEGMDLESLADSLIESEKSQLEALIDNGDSHGDLLKNLLANMEYNEEDERDSLLGKIKGAETGLRAKLKQEGRSMTAEILTSAATVAALGVAVDYALSLDSVQSGIEKIKTWFAENVDIDIEMPNFIAEKETGVDNKEKIQKAIEREGGIMENLPEHQLDKEFKLAEENPFDNLAEGKLKELEGLTEELSRSGEEAVLEVVDEIAEKQAKYAIESGDNIWSLSEEFLTDNWKGFDELTNSKQTYLIDYITKAVESDPEAFGLNLSEQETVNNIFAESGHKLDFGPLLDGSLDTVLENAEGLTTEEIAEALENNEALQEIIKESDLKLTPDQISESLSMEEVTEEKVAELAKENPLSNLKKGITEIPYSEGELTMEVEADNISFSLNGTEFAEGTFSENGQSISIEANKQIDLDYTKAYNSARINLQELLYGEDTQIMMEELKSESSTSAEQVANMEEWLTRLKNGELSEGSFDFIRGSQKEEWIEQLSKIEGVSYEEMEEMIEDGLEEISEKTSEAMTGASEEATETLEQEMEGYVLEGDIDIMDRLDFYDSFTNNFNIRVDTTTEITEALVNGEISPEEFVSWLETDAFEREVVFDGTENPPRENLEKRLSLLVEKIKTALEENSGERNTLLESARKEARKQIDQMMLYGK